VTETTAEVIVLILAAYTGIGFVSALAFLIFGARALDDGVPGSTKGAFVLIFPGLVALWPVMIAKWLIGRGADH